MRKFKLKKTITVLGSTGSIGTQTLDIARFLSLEVTGLCANSSVKLLARQAREFNVKYAVIGDETLYSDLKLALADTGISVSAGKAEVERLAAVKTDITLNAVVGIAGLNATLAAINAKNTLALANKESLVTAGELVIAAKQKSGASLLPVDSEHSAIFQCLNGENCGRINRLILTASGGPFFGKTEEQLEKITPADALHHPNWSMGKKITIDSATLMNKGLELIEAMHLFNVGADKIDIHVHRQSILHSAVEFCDGTVIGQLGVADMRIPIQYAVTYPDRLPTPAKPLSLFDVGTLIFEKPDESTFRCLAAAKAAAKMGGLYPCAVNGANEEAVQLFLDGKISFLKIGKLVESALELSCKTENYSISDVYEADTAARELVKAAV